MIIREIFNTVTGHIEATKREILLREKIEKLEIAPELIYDEMDAFTARQENFEDFSKTQSSLTSRVFTATLMDNLQKHGGDINSWKEYFSLIHQSIDDVKNDDEIEDEDNYLNQLEWRMEFLENHYNGRSQPMKDMLDIFASKRDIHDLCIRDYEANIKILNSGHKMLAEASNNKPNL